MAYITPANMRAGTLAEFAAGLPLSVSDASDSALESAISRLSERIDEWTHDHFEPESLTLDLDGEGHTRLWLPKRVRSITSVSTRGADGTLTPQDAANYRVRSSLNAAGTALAEDLGFDFIDIISSKVLSSGSVWPLGLETVQVVGEFSWAAPPAEIKRALALLVFDHFKPLRADLRRASRWSTAEVTIEAGISEPSGIPEVDDIVNNLRRVDPTLV